MTLNSIRWFQFCPEHQNWSITTNEVYCNTKDTRGARGARGVMVIVIRNGHDDTSSNPGQD